MLQYGNIINAILKGMRVFVYVLRNFITIGNSVKYRKYKDYRENME